MEKPVDVAVLLNAERKTDDNSCEVEFRIINEVFPAIFLHMGPLILGATG